MGWILLILWARIPRAGALSLREHVASVNLSSSVCASEEGSYCFLRSNPQTCPQPVSAMNLAMRLLWCMESWTDVSHIVPLNRDHPESNILPQVPCISTVNRGYF